MALVASLGVFGCTEEPAPSSDPSPSATASSAPTPTNLESGLPLTAEVIATSNFRESAYLRANQDFLIQLVSGRIVVEDRTANERIGEIALQSNDLELLSVTLHEEWLAWNYGDPGDPGVIPHLFARNLRTGAEVAVSPEFGLPAPGLPSGYDLHDGVLSYTSQRARRGRNCIVAVDLGGLQTQVMQCTKTRHHGTAKPHYSPYGLVFNQWNPDPKPQGCVQLLHWLAATERLRNIPSQRDCAAWSGVAGQHLVVWSEPSPSTPEQAKLYAQEDGGAITRLGKGDTSTEQLCGDLVYWNAMDGEIGEIRRFVPGAGVETVYRMPETGSLLLGAIHCSGNSLTFTQAADGPDRVDLMEVVLEQR